MVPQTAAVPQPAPLRGGGGGVRCDVAVVGLRVPYWFYQVQEALIIQFMPFLSVFGMDADHCWNIIYWEYNNFIR